jgi:hypothetical protein
MASDVLKDLGARRPVDRTAALVISRGYHFDYRKIPGCVLSETPPCTTARPSTAPDLNGRRIGRLTVIGFCGRVRKKTTAGNTKTLFYYSVRCDCGLYSIRRKQAVLNPYNCADACERCKHLLYLQREDRRRAGLGDVD